MEKVNEDVVTMTTTITVKYRRPSGEINTKRLSRDSESFHSSFENSLKEHGLEEYLIYTEDGRISIDTIKYFEDTGKVFIARVYYEADAEDGESFENISVKPISFKKETIISLTEYF